MGTDYIQCKHCGIRIRLRAQNPGQKYCTKPECQRAKKRRWQRQKMQSDADYRANQREAAKRWRAKNPGYWREYRSRNKAYRQRNRQQQHQRNQRRRNSAKCNIANMDASERKTDIKPGRYQMIPVSEKWIANMDASIVEIAVIQSGYP